MSLAQKVFKGFIWSSSSLLGAQLLSFLIKLVLLRLLVPEDFGTLGLTFVVTNAIQLINQLGLHVAITQKLSVDDKDLSSAFFLSLTSGLLFCLVTFSISPWVGAFFNKPVLATILKVVAFEFIISATGTVSRALLQRAINFKAISLSELTGVCFSGITSITLAFSGYGVWSLVWGHVVHHLVMNISIVLRAKWRPHLSFDKTRASGLFGFSKHLIGGNLINFASQNFDNLMIGKYLGAHALGLYQVSYDLISFPQMKLSAIVAEVTFPALSQMQNDNQRFREAYLRTIRFITTVNFPLLIGLALVAPEFIRTFFGDQWEPAIFPIQILAAYGLMKSIVTTIGLIFNSKGRPDIGFRFNIIMFIATLIAVFIGIQFDIRAVAIAIACRGFLLFPLGVGLAIRLIELPFSAFLNVMIKPTLASFVMILTVSLTRIGLHQLHLSNGLILTLSILTGAVTYTLISLVINQAMVLELKSLLLKKKNQ